MDFDIPDTQLARKATELVASVSPEFLYHHAVRTFIFADYLGKRDGLKYDRELLYLGAIMHDLGLTETYFGKQRFEVEGADAAHAFVVRHNLSDEKADLLWDAIALHTTVGVALRKQPEIALVCLGTAADTSGRRIKEFDAESVQKILDAYPRLGFKKESIELLLGYVKKNPQVVPFTWMSDVARSHSEFVCPTVAEIILSSPFMD